MLDGINNAMKPVTIVGQFAFEGLQSLGRFVKVGRAEQWERQLTVAGGKSLTAVWPREINNGKIGFNESRVAGRATRAIGTEDLRQRFDELGD